MRTTRDMRIACVAALLGATVPLGVSTFADEYVGCGHPSLAQTTCLHCLGTAPPGGQPSCNCVLYSCSQGAYECTQYSNAFTQCAPEETQAVKVYTDATAKCKQRKKCNNANGVDLGPCDGDGSCTQSDEWTYFGDSRVKYYTLNEVCNCQA